MLRRSSAVSVIADVVGVVVVIVVEVVVGLAYGISGFDVDGVNAFFISFHRFRLSKIDCKHVEDRCLWKHTC